MSSVIAHRIKHTGLAAFASIAIVAGLITGGAGARSGAGCPQFRASAPFETFGTVLRGDVDGDGRRDVVYLATRSGASVACRYVLIAATSAKQRISIPISQQGVGAAPDLRPWPAGLPALDALARVDTRAGAEIAVSQWSGSSTLFIAVYTVRDGRLVRFELGKPFAQPTPATNTFPVGGSFDTVGGLDCGAPASGQILSSYAVRSGSHYRIVRTYYRVEGVGLREIRRARVTSKDLPAEFRGIFAHCSVASPPRR